jgi:hypothetical protein
MDNLQLMKVPSFAGVLITICLFPVAVIVYRLFYHPLSPVPGPKAAAATRLWYAYQVRKGRARWLTQMLHEKYGPIVRVTPNMVWFNTEDGFKEVYSEAFRPDCRNWVKLTILRGWLAIWKVRLVL